MKEGKQKRKRIRKTVYYKEYNSRDLNSRIKGIYFEVHFPMITVQDKALVEPYTVYIENFNFQRYLEFANEDLDCELLDGMLVIHLPASFMHENIFSFLLTVLKLYTEQNALGTVIGSRFSMKISELWAPEPDIMFIAKNNPSQINETFLNGPASVVFEILSPSTRKEDIQKKLPQYLCAGVEEIWIIDPINQKVEIHSSENIFSYLENDWAISIVIHGFKIKPSWLWNSEIIPILDALNEINTE